MAERALPNEFAVQLSQQDTDHLLAAVEVALNAEPELDFGPGMRRWAIEQAARKLEAVADLQRQGIVIGEHSPAQVDELVRAAREERLMYDVAALKAERESRIADAEYGRARVAMYDRILAPFPDPKPEGEARMKPDNGC